MGTYLHINDDCPPTSAPSTSIPIDTIVNNTLIIEDDDDEHKYTNFWDMMRPYEKIGDFRVN